MTAARGVRSPLAGLPRRVALGFARQVAAVPSSACVASTEVGARADVTSRHAAWRPAERPGPAVRGRGAGRPGRGSGARPGCATRFSKGGQTALAQLGKSVALSSFIQPRTTGSLTYSALCATRERPTGGDRIMRFMLHRAGPSESISSCFGTRMT